jgi:hypothetical protein
MNLYKTHVCERIKIVGEFLYFLMNTTLMKSRYFFLFGVDSTFITV